MRPLTWVTIEEVASGDWASPARPRTRATSSHALRRRAGPAAADGQEDLLEALGASSGRAARSCPWTVQLATTRHAVSVTWWLPPAPRRNQKTSWPSLR
jgi:hypothetical protein